MACENGDVEIYEERDKEKYIKLLVEYIEKFVNDKLTEYSK
jgi:genome maintenance exonuclease 1